MTKRKNSISTGIKSVSRTLVDMNVVPHMMMVNSAARHPIKRGALDIRPVITLKQGEIFPSGIDRGRKRTTRKALNLLLEYLQESTLNAACYSLAVGYGYDREEGIAFRDQSLSILREKGYAVSEMPVYQIGATIGVHTGPYPLGFGIIERGIHS